MCNDKSPVGEVKGALGRERKLRMNQRLGYVWSTLLAVSRRGWSQFISRWYQVGAQRLSSSAASSSGELSFPPSLRIGMWKQLGWVLLATSRSHEVAVKMLAGCTACRVDS